MFRTGYRDRVTIKRKTLKDDVNHNKVMDWDTVVHNSPCELYHSSKGSKELSPGMMISVVEKVFLKSSVDIRTNDVAVIGEHQYAIMEVIKARGFHGHHYELFLGRRTHSD